MIDRVAETGADERLVGRLAGDEPPENAHILCDLYVQSPDRGRCRRLTQEDLLGAPFVVSGEAAEAAPDELIGAVDCTYQLAAAPAGLTVPALRWRRRSALAEGDPGVRVILRDVVAALDS